MRSQCARRSYALTAAAIVTMLTAHPVAAQRAADYEARLDSIGELWSAAAAEAERHRDAVGREVAALDTVRVGAISMVTTPGARATARWGLQRALESISRQYGPVMDLLVDSVANRPAFIIYDVEVPGTAKVRFAVSEDVRERAERRNDMGVDSADIVAVLYHRLRRTLIAHASPELARWLNGAVPLDTGSASDWARLRIELLSNPMSAARDCFHSSVEDCLRALAMDPVRGSLVQEAILLGGPEAVSRLLRARGDIHHQLQVTSGVTIDSLTRSWIAHLRSAQPPSETLQPAVLLGSLAWILVFGGFAARSSRWR